MVILVSVLAGEAVAQSRVASRANSRRHNTLMTRVRRIKSIGAIHPASAPPLGARRSADRSITLSNVPTYLNQRFGASRPRASPMAAYHNILSNKQSIKASSRGPGRGRTAYGANYKQLDAMLPPRRASPRSPAPRRAALAHLVITLFIAY